MSAPIITEDKIRLFLQDKPELNPLLQGVRWTAEEIENAAILTVDYYNSIPPPTGENFTIETFPYAYILLMGVCGLLLRGSSVNQASNQLSYSAEGVQVNDMDKAQIFSSLGGEFWSEAKEMMKQAKITSNIQGAYGSKFSEYRYRAR